MKRLIRRQQVIDCGATTCGNCKQRLSHSAYCTFWKEGLNYFNRGKRFWFLRCCQCKSAEVSKP